MAEVGFREASGGAKTALLLGLVAMVGWMALSAFFVLALTALGLGNCDETCATRATAAIVGSLAVHVLAMVASAVVVFRSMTTFRRVVLLVVLAVAVPVGTLVGSFLLASTSG